MHQTVEHGAADHSRAVAEELILPAGHALSHQRPQRFAVDAPPLTGSACQFQNCHRGFVSHTSLLSLDVGVIQVDLRHPADLRTLRREDRIMHPLAQDDEAGGRKEGDDVRLLDDAPLRQATRLGLRSGSTAVFACSSS